LAYRPAQATWPTGPSHPSLPAQPASPPPLTDRWAHPVSEPVFFFLRPTPPGATAATSHACCRRPDDPSSPGNVPHSPPPSSLPTHPLRFAFPLNRRAINGHHRHRRPIPSRPDASTPPRPPIKRRGAHPHLTALIPAPFSSRPSPEHCPHRTPSTAAALPHRRLDWLTPPPNLTAGKHPRPPLHLSPAIGAIPGAQSGPWPSSGGRPW
jgi:hypothetical protein